MTRLPVRLGVLLAGLALAPAAFAQTFTVTATTGGAPAPEAHVRVDWTATGVAGERYEIRRTLLAEGQPPVAQGVIAVRPQGVTSFEDTRTRPGTAYEYCVTPATSGTPAACATGSRDLRRPGALQATDSTRTDGVALSWTDLSSVEVGYVVFRGAPTDPAPQAGTLDGLTPIDTTTADATGALDITAVAGQHYRYCVGILDGFGGVEAVVPPLSCDYGARAVVAPPSGVAASDGTLDDRVRVVWTARPGITYTVFRSASGQPRAALASDLTASPFEDLTAVGGTAYTYCVTASTADGESVAACDGGQRGSLAPPADAAAADGVSDGGVEVTWRDPGPTETGFRLYRQPVAGGPDELIATVPANRTRYTDRTALPDVPYTYCVAAIATVKVDGADVTSESARSCEAGHFVAILPPTAFAATDAATGPEGHVELTWESASEVVQLFLVERDGEVLAALPPFARSYRDATGLSGQPYDYKVVAMTVIGVDLAGLTQGLSPLFSRADAEKGALAADRAEADDARARARLDARAAALEATLIDDIEALLAGLGVDAAGLTTSAGGEVRTAATAEVAGTRRLRAPGDVAATQTLEDRVRITWADRSGVETDYQVRATYGAGIPPTTTQIGPNRTEWVDIEAPAGAEVTYEVRALDRDPAVAESGSAWAAVTGRRVLLPPGRVTARQQRVETELVVAWRDSSRAETGYAVTAGLAAGPQTFLAEANARELVVPIQPADFGRAIPITVRATHTETAKADVPSESAAGSVSATPTLLAPRVVTASTEYPNQVVIAWSDESSANDGYRVVRLGASPATLTATGTTAIDEAPAGPADYCVTPTLTGAEPEPVSDAEPEPVCASGRVSATTAPSTGDVVSTFTRVGGLGTGPEGFGAVLAAEDGLLVVGAPDDAFVFEASNPTPVWARPLAPSLADDPVGSSYYFNQFTGWNPDFGNTGHFEVAGSVGLTSFYTRTPEGGWSNVSNIQLQATDAFTYRRFGADVDIDGDIAIIGAPGPATFHTHPILKRSSDPQYISSVTYGDGGAYIYQRGSNGTWIRVGTLRGLGFASNSFTPNDALTRTAPFGVDEFGGVSYLTTRKYQDFGPYEGGWFVQSLQEIRNDPRPLHVERMGELVALTSKWAVSSFVYRTRPSGPNHVVGLYRSTGPYDYIGILDGPAGFDSATGALAADDSAVGTVVAIGSGAGAVRLHELNAAGTSVAETDLAPATGPSSEFGASVDVVADGAMAADGHLVVVGAPGAGDNAVYIYRRTSGFSWTLEQRITPESGDTRFGTSVAIGDGLIAVGAEKDGAPGVAYTLRLDAGIWVKSARLTPDPAAGVVAESRFGAAVASDADDLVIGAPGTRAEGRQQGSIYFATVSVSPSGVDASDGRYANRVQVRWEDETGVEDGYRVYRRGPTDGDHELVGTLGPNAEVFDDFDVSPGDVYQYCVASFLGEDETNTNPLGESGRACDAGYTPPNGTITGRLATGEGAPVLGAGVCLAPGLDQAVMFDGLGGRAVVSNFGALPAAFTVQAWVHADGYSDGANPVVGVDGASYAMLEVVGAGGAGSPRLRVLNDGDDAATVIDAPALTPGWHHLAATHDGTTLALYVDGQPAGTAAFAGASTARGAFQMAADRAGNAFDGRLDDVRVWSRALTPAQVATAHQQAQLLEGDEVDLYAYWAIDQGIGRIVTDLTAGGRHATLQAGAEWTREGAPLNTCALSDGDGNYTFAGLRYGDRTAFRITPTDPSRQFTPAVRTATLTPESPTENQMDFTDSSSFTVRGRVVHPFDQTDWPGQAPLAAAGVDILVDGTAVATTESDGTFAIAIRGTGEHVFQARNDSLGLAFTATFDGQPFADGVARLATTRDLDGLVFASTTQRVLRGQATGGCGFGIGDVAFRLYTEDRRFDRTFPADGAPLLGATPYVFDLPPLEYRMEFVSVRNVPAPLSPTAVTDYFRNVGVLEADLRTEADTVDFRYRAPITLAVLRDGAPFAESAAMCDAGYTVYDATNNPVRTLPNVPVIGEYKRVPLVFHAYENYGAGNECDVEAGTVRIFDGFADAAATPVEVELDATGRAGYTTFGRSPDTFAGRTVGGVDRSYQKSLTAVLEVPDGPTVTATEWAYVEGYREKPATFVTATMGEIPVMVLRDPPGSQSSAYVEEGTSSCVSLSELRAVTSEGGLAADLKVGFKLLTGLFAIVENGFGLHLAATTLIGGTTESTTGPENNISICATATERWQTSDDPQWTGEDIYTGVGLNVLFAEADVVTTDASNPAECRVDLSTTLAAGLDDADPFETVFAYGTSHIEDVLIPELESLARLAGEDASVDGQVDGQDASIPLTRAIDNWHGMVAYNDSLRTAALAGEVENRSFSGGTSYEFGTTADTTLTSSGTNSVYFKHDSRVGLTFTLFGHDSVVDAVVNFQTETTTTREETETETFGVGYSLADGDAGDYFTVDVARDPRYGTYVFNTVSGASSNPWETGTQKRDLPRLAVDPPVLNGVLEGDRAVYTLSLTNASESDERREYVIDAPAHLNPDGAVLRVNGDVLTKLPYTVDARQTISIPVTVERGPLVDDYDLAIVAYAEGDLHRVAADTARFHAGFRPLVAPLRLSQPLDGWTVSLGAPPLNLLLSDIDTASQATFGIAFRRANGAWQEDMVFTADDLAPGATEISIPWTATGLPDGAYELRAFARSASVGPPDYYGPSVPGWIDRTAPVAYGPPHPADRELALGETIGITFEEPVGCDLFRERLTGPLAAASLVGPGGTVYTVDVGCADRTVLLAPTDPSIWTLIEGQLVTARVRGIPDLAGNSMARLPDAEAGWDANWTFTVRRNAFGWTPSIVAVNAQRGVPTELPAALVNGRSQPVTYDLVPNNPGFDPGSTAEATRPFKFDGPGGPVYLTASGYSGTVVSGDVQPIAFRWPAVTTEGTYTARVGVESVEAGEDLGTSYLDLSVEVSCTAPPWLAQAGAIAPAFENAMSVTAELRFPGGASTNTADLLAAYVDGELRGAAPIRLVTVDRATVGRAEVLVYGTGAAERVVFRAWEDPCTLHPTTSRVLEFNADQPIGTLEAPFVIDAPGDGGGPLEVPLAAGWTWVSTNRAGTSPLASALVGVGASETDLIQGQAAFSAYTPGAGWSGGLTGMDPGAGYHIRLAAPATMTHPGAPVDPALPVGLRAGWNWIGYLPTSPLSLDDALASVTFAQDDMIKGQGGFAFFVDGFGWQGSLPQLDPGLGYHLYVAEDATLRYPASTADRTAGMVAAALQARPVRRMDTLPVLTDRPTLQALAAAAPSTGPVPEPTPDPDAGPAVASAPAAAVTTVAPAYEHTMAITATLDGAPEGLHLAAYASTDGGEELRGLAPVQTVEVLGGSRAYLLAAGEPGEDIVLRPVLVSDTGDLVPTGDLRFPDGLPGADDPTPVDAVLAFARDGIVGTAAWPVALSMGGATAAEEAALPTEVGLSPTRPNPFSVEATFAFGLPTPTAVRLVVYDVLGREVAVLVDEDRAAGHHTVRFDGRALASGTYIARLTAGPEVRTRTFTVAR